MAAIDHDIAEAETNGHGTAPAAPSPTSGPAPGTSTHEFLNAIPPTRPWSLGPIRRARRLQWEEDTRRWMEEKRQEDPRIEFRRSFEILPGSRYLVHNRTPYLIRLERDDDPEFGELVLPPFAERVVKGARIRPFEDQLRVHRQRHEIFLRRHEERVSAFDKLIVVVWVSVVALTAVAIYDLLAHGTFRRPEFIAAAIATAAIVVIVLASAAFQEARRKRDAAATAAEAGDVAFGIGGAYSDGNETARQAQQLLTLALVLFVGMILPAAAIIFATDTHEFLIVDGGLRVVENRESRLVARIIQITYTVILSLFPALLYFQFDRQRAGSLRANWVRNLFRMDSRMRTIADVNATYGTAMYEASNNSDDSVKVLGGKHSPIVVATILIALGWTILVVRTESYDFQRTTEAAAVTEVAEQSAERANEAAADAETAGDESDAEAAAANAEAAAAAAQVAESAAADIAEDSTVEPGATASADEPATPEPAPTPPGDAQASAQQADQSAANARNAETVISSTPFFQVLAPRPSASGMAFLGAYFFGVYLVLRSYLRGDLRAKIYNQITARLVTVVVVAYLINAILVDAGWQETTVWALAFLAGVMPSTVVDFVFKSVGGVVKRIGSGRFTPTRPLEHLDGVDIYDSTRLESEGIPDVAALANGDLARLMITTRLPVGRLVDWADQAALMVVVSPGTPRELDRRIWALRSRGVRTGTDMLSAIEEGKDLDAIRKCLELDPERGSDGVGDDAPAPPSADTTPRAPEPVVTADRNGSSDSTDAHSASSQDPTPVIHQEADLSELAEAIRRQPVMRQILQWRSSPLDEIDEVWIELPEYGTLPDPSRIYQGPLPDPTTYRMRAESPGA